MPSKNKWLIFLGASLMILLINIDATIVNLGLATIAKDLHTNLAEIQWIINSYFLTTIILFIVGGRLSDLFGPKKIFLVGTLFFTIASLIAGLSVNFPWLIVGRLLQGVGFAFTLSLALLMISHAFPENQRGFVLGLAITITGLGQALGPTVGGVILEELNWHWIFLINIPIATLSFILILFFGDSGTPSHTKASIDYIGTLWLAIALTLLLLTFNTLTQHHFNYQLFFGGLIAAFVIFIGFYRKEIKTKAPLVDFKLFKRRDYSISIAIRFLFMYLYGIFLFFIPLYLQNILGFSPLVSGLMILVYSSLLAICSPMAGIWCDQMGYKIPIVSASIFTVIAFILLATINMNTSIHLVLLGMACFGLCTGIMIPSTVNSTLSSLPKTSAGEGLGMFFTVAFLGSSLGVAISGAQINLVTTHYLLTQQPLISSLTPVQFDMLHRVSNGTQPLLNLNQFFGANQYPVFSLLAKQIFTKGLSSVMGLNIILSLLITVLALFMKKRSATRVSN